MSKVADLTYDIQELFIEGHSTKAIAAILECPIEIVLETLETFGVDSEDLEDEQGPAASAGEAVFAQMVVQLDNFDPFDTVNS